MKTSIVVGLLAFPIIMLVAQDARAQSLEADGVRIKSTFIVVDTLTVPAAGWIVAHRAESPVGVVPGEIIGVVAVKSGTNKNVELPAPETLEKGSGIILMLHEDHGTIGSFEEEQDKPVMEGGKPLMKAVNID